MADYDDSANESSAVAEMGDHSQSRHGPKRGGGCWTAARVCACVNTAELTSGEAEFWNETDRSLLPSTFVSSLGL